jgi:hypothetical protein
MGLARVRGSRVYWILVLALLSVGAFLGSSRTSAHHSFSAVFDANRPVKISGTITRVEWSNPHIWFYLNVTGDDGGVTEWGFSGGPPGVLMRRGITKDVLKIGSIVNVEGFLARDGSHNASGGRVTFPDGRNVFTASNEDAIPGR